MKELINAYPLTTGTVIFFVFAFSLLFTYAWIRNKRLNEFRECLVPGQQCRVDVGNDFHTVEIIAVHSETCFVQDFDLGKKHHVPIDCMYPI